MGGELGVCVFTYQNNQQFEKCGIKIESLTADSGVRCLRFVLIYGIRFVCCIAVSVLCRVSYTNQHKNSNKNYTSRITALLRLLTTVRPWKKTVTIGYVSPRSFTCRINTKSEHKSKHQHQLQSNTPHLYGVFR